MTANQTQTSTAAKVRNTAKKAGRKGTKATKERRDVHAEIANRLADQMAKGAAPWLKPWNSTARFSGMPRNAVSKRAYSGINVLILWIEAAERGFTSSEWLTFKQAKELGGNIKKGAKSVEIVFYKKLSFTEINEQTGEEEERNPLLLKTFRVFNLDEVENLPDTYQPAPVEPVGDRGELNVAFQEAMLKTGANIKHGGNVAAYAPVLDYIKMPDAETFRDAANYQAVLCHELVHWSGSERRLARFKDDQPADKIAYAFEELVAELGAAFGCAEFGVEGDLRHAAYLQSWAKHIKDDPKFLFRAASRASKAMAYLFPNQQQETELKQAA